MDQPSLDQIGAALQAAHDAGDTDGAQRLADYYRQVQGNASQPNAAVVTPRPDDIVVRPTADQLDDAKPSFLDGVGRQLSMSAHNVAEGAPGIIDALTALPRAGLNYALDKAGVDPSYRFGTLGDAASQGLTAAGIPDYQPQTPAEGYTQAIGRGLSSVAGGFGLGGGLAATQSPGLANAGNILLSNQALQATSATTGSASAEFAKQHGAGAGGQIAAGLVGGLVPSIPAAVGAGVQTALRGGNANVPNVQQNIADFANAGTTPTVGQATQTPFAQGAESLLSKTPGAINVMKGASANQADQVSNRLSSMADTLSPNADSGAAGQAIIRGVSGPGGFVDQFKNNAQTLYNKLDNYLPANKPVPVANVQQALADITGGIQGAPATSALLQNPQLVKIQQAIQSDAQNGMLPYSAVKQIRSAIGDQLSDFSLTNDVPKAQLSKVYSALSDDMQQAAKTAGPKAEQAWNDANSFYKSGQERIDTLQRVVDKNGGPEAVFNAAMSGTKDGSTTLNNVMDSLGAPEQKTVSAAVLNRLGKANPGQQNAAGDEFSMNTFLTNWNKLSPQAKSTLFDRYGPDFSKNMDAVANVADNVRQGSKYLANPSGTAPTLASQSTFGALALSALTGHLGTAGAIGAGLGGANLAARLMTNPTFVKFLATKSNVPVQGLVPTLSALQTTAQEKKDPDLKAAADIIQQQANQP
jgi:hypothetical protein